MGAYIPLYNPNNNPQPANIDITHIANRYATHNGQSATNIANYNPQRTNKPIYNPLQQYKQVATHYRHKAKIQPISATKTDYNSNISIFYTIILYTTKNTITKYINTMFIVSKYNPQTYTIEKSLNFFVKSIAYQKYFISLHHKLCLNSFKVHLFIVPFKTLAKCLHLFVL